MGGVSTRMVWGLMLAAGCLFAQGPMGWEREPIRDIRVRIDGQWVLAGQGRDETAQMVQVRIWGTRSRAVDLYRASRDQRL